MINRVIGGGTRRVEDAAEISVTNNDFSGKKLKMLQTLRNVDELRSGIVKLQVFQNLLECLDVEVLE